jgi:prepilin-type N-terminal cleavage/methylation domain-containing protein
MSTADRHGSRRHRTAGFTFIEVSVAMALLALMSLVIERTLTTTYNSERYLSAVRKATERGQKISYEIFDSVSASRKLFQGDALGMDYLEALELDRDPIAAAARLPVFDEVGALGPDVVGDPRTGNVLLFVRESDPAPCVADPMTGRVRYIDTYRFVCVYPHLTDGRIVADDAENALDLIVWRSVPYPSLSQINAIQDVGERAKVVADLFSRYGHEVAWDPNQPVGQAFHEIDFLGVVNGVPEADPVIEEDPDASSRGRLAYTKVQLARTVPGAYHRRAVFTLDDPNDWEPNGFEVKVSGASGSRKVWIHLVVECQARRGETAVHENTMVASTRDL